MIIYLTNREIDRQRWDACIAGSVNGLVYGNSWYLDITSPGWDCLVEEDYSAVFPLTHRTRFGVRYLYQPFFTQQLGLFSTSPLTPDRVSEFLSAISRRFRFAEIQLNSFNKPDPGLFEVEYRQNHEMELIRPYDQLLAGYSQNVRRNLRKALENHVTVRRKVDGDELVTLFRNNFGKREGKLSYRDYLTISELIRTCTSNGAGILMGAGKEGAGLDAGAFFLRDSHRFIFLFSASDYRTRDNGAMFLLLDTFIREHSSRPVILDFEGGNNPSLARFYKSFGSSESRYPLVRINRLPRWMEMTRGIYKWARGK